MTTLKYLEIKVEQNDYRPAQLCTRKELASLLTLSYYQVVQLIKQREIKFQNIGGVFLYDPKDFGF